MSKCLKSTCNGLSNPGRYREYVTPSSHDRSDEHQRKFNAPGDAIIFCSHKYHTVQPVRSGRRRVCVLEFWEGERRACCHRCDKHWGGCPFVREEAKRSSMACHFLAGS